MFLVKNNGDHHVYALNMHVSKMFFSTLKTFSEKLHIFWNEFFQQLINAMCGFAPHAHTLSVCNTGLIDLFTSIYFYINSKPWHCVVADEEPVTLFNNKYGHILFNFGSPFKYLSVVCRVKVKFTSGSPAVFFTLFNVNIVIS